MSDSSRLTRRSLVQLLGAAAAGTVTFPTLVRALERAAERDRTAAPAAPHDATAPAATLPRIGLQLYTVRSAMNKDVEGTIAAVAAAGVKELEFAGYYNRTPQQWEALLKQHGLSGPSTHVGLPNTDDEWKPVFDAAAAMSIKYVVVPSVNREYSRSGDGWKRLATRLNAAGELAKKAGLRMGYHNHDGEFAVVDGAPGYDTLMAGLDPKLVDMEIDLYWAVKAGQDPLAMIARWPGRFALCHVKDASAAPERAMRDVGAGTIDFAKIFAKGKQAGFKHWFIEHDQPADALASVKASATYLAQLKY